MGIANIMSTVKLKRWMKRGLRVGNDFKLEKGASIDPSFPWLIEIGDQVTIAPNVLILAHDGSTKSFINYSKIGKVKIGNRVFIGAKSIILPNVTIGDNVVIGAGSIVIHDVPSNSVVAGAPACVISSLDTFIEKNKEIMKRTVLYDSTYTIAGKVTEEKKNAMKHSLSKGIAYID